ncbi:DNA ligase [Stenotrophomonas sp. Iso1]|uniref:DNA ligase n=1 Tax=Stenotrophomonas sp. Iso1 TaxID=2977283 RepID=UPI0022B7A5A6|nr:DNA ligase [Stenotrophomonas sp. Iso1]
MSPATWSAKKLDGVRARWDGSKLISRAGHVIPAPVWFTQQWPQQPLDGELWSSRSNFDAISATIRRTPADDEQWRTLRFMAFDLPAHPGTFEQRLATMRGVVHGTGNSHLAVIAQQRVVDTASLHAQLRQVVAAGGEGLMLHHQDNRYLPGRSEGLLKLKPFEDTEARVVGYVTGKGKYEGMVGALQMQADDGRRFRIGSGLSDAQRANPPAIGSLVTYRYNGLTVHGLPRFARFLRVREEATSTSPIP